jgi:hypothetical protein
MAMKKVDAGVMSMPGQLGDAAYSALQSTMSEEVLQ